MRSNCLPARSSAKSSSGLARHTANYMNGDPDVDPMVSSALFQFSNLMASMPQFNSKIVQRALQGRRIVLGGRATCPVIR